MNQLLIKDLKGLYEYSNNQHEIYKYDKNLTKSLKSIERKGKHELKSQKGIFLGVQADGKIQFQSSHLKRYEKFGNKDVLTKMNSNRLKKDSQMMQDFISFEFNDEEYYGIYKYNARWQTYILRAEELDEFESESRQIFINISLLILAITIFVMVIGVYILKYILRYVDIISSAIMKMLETQQLEVIDLKRATNDDITYLGMAFNSLSSTVDNLISIFRKFANRDIVVKAYRDREVKLEGTKMDLTILFTDIKSFTFITETLGNDIIKLLNLHYDKAIREILNYDGVIGSIIGDALLAVFGVMDDNYTNKSYQAVLAAYKQHEVANSLQDRMSAIRDDLIEKYGKLTEDEEKVYKAVLLEIGVGIDGGEVFYGTLGSYVRMTNTVIGDSVNAASRLEGLTREYHVPVICSEYVKIDIETNVANHGIEFVEIDIVMVKGKTQGKRVYWPVFERDIDKAMRRSINQFLSGLALYYEGDWPAAGKKFKASKLPVAEVFFERTLGKCPKNWKGIWEMKTK